MISNFKLYILQFYVQFQYCLDLFFNYFFFTFYNLVNLFSLKVPLFHVWHFNSTFAVQYTTVHCTYMVTWSLLRSKVTFYSPFYIIVGMLKFIYSEKATQLIENLPTLLLWNVKKNWEFFPNLLCGLIGIYELYEKK